MIETGFVARIVGIDMIIDKVYNNNIVQLIGENKEEIIAMGRGIGFQKNQVKVLTIHKLRNGLYLKIKKFLMIYRQYIVILVSKKSKLF